MLEQMKTAPDRAHVRNLDKSSAVVDGTNDDAPMMPKGAVHTDHKIPRPATAQGTRILWPYVFGIGSVHVMALLAFVPYFWSWTAAIAGIFSLYFFNTLGINLCYHRLLTHQGFTCPKWLEHSLATLGVCCLQDTPARWVAIHRIHHQHSDEQPDPHSPWADFFWGHIGWLLVENTDLSKLSTYERYARDILRDPFYLRFERNIFWMWTYVLHALAIFGLGFGIGYIWTGTPVGALQFGASLWLWCVVVRTVVAWHITWSVNSLSHIWGYRNYETDESSRNNWFVALISNGEGWHNNHHADQRSAAHGHRWWEFDVTWITIRVLETVGLAKNVVRPRSKRAS